MPNNYHIKIKSVDHLKNDEITYEELSDVGLNVIDETKLREKKASHEAHENEVRDLKGDKDSFIEIDHLTNAEKTLYIAALLTKKPLVIKQISETGEVHTIEDPKEISPDLIKDIILRILFNPTDTNKPYAQEHIDILKNAIRSIPDDIMNKSDTPKFIKEIIPEVIKDIIKRNVAKESGTSSFIPTSIIFKTALKHFPNEAVNTLFQSPEQYTHKQIVLIRNAIQSIPDDVMSISDKHKLIKEHFGPIKHHFNDLAYDEELNELRIDPKISPLRNINLREYQLATNVPPLFSDYIVLSVGLLYNLFKGELPKTLEGAERAETIQRLVQQYQNDIEAYLPILKRIEKQYFELNYEACLADIKTLCEKIKENENAKKPNENAYVIACCDNILEAENRIQSEKDANVDLGKHKNVLSFLDKFIKQNKTRRIFENHFCQLMVGEANKNNVLPSISKITKVVLNEDIKEIKDLEQAVVDVSECPGLDEREIALKMGSDKYKTKDRSVREDLQAREIESRTGKMGRDAVYSRNLANLMANDPNFRDQITDRTIRNRVPDVNRPSDDPALSPDKFYFRAGNRFRGAYISSLSGHAFRTVAALESYMEKNKEDPDLEKDINNFVRYFIATYAKKGYHSLHEVLDVFREPNIQALFKAYKINLDIEIDPEIYSASMRHALLYSKNQSQIRNFRSTILQTAIQTMNQKIEKQKLRVLNKLKSKVIHPEDTPPKEAMEYQNALAQQNHFLYSNMGHPDLKRPAGEFDKLDISKMKNQISEMREKVMDAEFELTQQVPNLKSKNFNTFFEMLDKIVDPNSKKIPSLEDAVRFNLKPFMVLQKDLTVLKKLSKLKETKRRNLKAQDLLKIFDKNSLKVTEPEESEIPKPYILDPYNKNTEIKVKFEEDEIVSASDLLLLRLAACQNILALDSDYYSHQAQRLKMDNPYQDNVKELKRTIDELNRRNPKYMERAEILLVEFKNKLKTAQREESLTLEIPSLDGNANEQITLPWSLVEQMVEHQIYSAPTKAEVLQFQERNKQKEAAKQAPGFKETTYRYMQYKERDKARRNAAKNVDESASKKIGPKEDKPKA